MWSFKLSRLLQFFIFWSFTGNRQKAIFIFPHNRELWLPDPDNIQMERWKPRQSVLWSPTEHSDFWFDWSAVCSWMTLAWGLLKLWFWQSRWVTAELWLCPFNQLHRGGALWFVALHQNFHKKMHHKKTALVKTSVRAVNHFALLWPLRH